MFHACCYGLNVNCPQELMCVEGSAFGGGRILGTMTLVEVDQCGWALKALTLSGPPLSFCVLVYQDVNKPCRKLMPLRMLSTPNAMPSVLEGTDVF